MTEALDTDEFFKCFLDSSKSTSELENYEDSVGINEGLKATLKLARSLCRFQTASWPFSLKNFRLANKKKIEE